MSDIIFNLKEVQTSLIKKCQNLELSKIFFYLIVMFKEIVEINKFKDFIQGTYLSTNDRSLFLKTLIGMTQKIGDAF